MPALVSGTRVLFENATAPIGWIKETAFNNFGIRITSGTALSRSGVDFSTVMSTYAFSSTVNSDFPGTTSQNAQDLPAHTHSVSPNSGNYFSAVGSPAPTYWTATGPTGTTLTSFGIGTFSIPQTTSTNPSNLQSPTIPTTHGHTVSYARSGVTTDSLNLNVKYVDVILAIKE